MKPIYLVLLAIVIGSGLGCKLTSLFSTGEFTQDADHFAVKFPGGSADVETQKGKAKNKYVITPGTIYSKEFDNHSDNFRSYEVNVFSLKADPPTDISSESTIRTLGLNGWYGEPETKSKEVTINGIEALDSVCTITLGTASMTFREVVFWSDKEKLLYVIRIAATKKENVTTQEAEDFVQSFKMV
jgi:hypothetical protein